MIVRTQAQIRTTSSFHAGSNFQNVDLWPFRIGENKCSPGYDFPPAFYDKIYLYAKNLDQTKYQRLLKTFRPISKEAGYDVVEASQMKSSQFLN